MTEETIFDRLCTLNFQTRKNKRYGRDAMAFEVNWPALLVRYMDAVKEKSLRLDHNYTFLSSLPCWREIMATDYTGRLTDHDICDVLMPYIEQELSPRTYNNRKGMGSMAAINQVMEDIYEVSRGYTVPARVIKNDISGFFPNALWNYAEQCLVGIINKYSNELTTQGVDVDELRWKVMIAVHANPAAHCERRTPAYFWKLYIKPEKSILTKPEGVGAAIGRLLWQTCMGLYINDDIKWLNEECGIHTVCFVDDIVMVVPETMHGYALSLIPILRERFATKGIKLNGRKFYDQPIEHGLEFLGSHIKPNRLHLNNDCYGRAIERINELNKIKNKERYVDNFVASVNSYTGMLKNRTDYQRMVSLIKMIDNEWWRYVCWNASRQCVAVYEKYKEAERLNRKYSLNLKKKKNYEKSKFTENRDRRHQG